MADVYQVNKAGFDVHSKQIIDSRLVLSKAEMLAMLPKYMPSVSSDKKYYFAWCTDDKCWYYYDPSLSAGSAETGKFVKMDIKAVELTAAERAAAEIAGTFADGTIVAGKDDSGVFDGKLYYYDKEQLKFVAVGGGSNPDEKTIILNSEGKLTVPIDNKTLVYDDSEKCLKVQTRELVMGDALYITSEGIMNVLFDDDSIKLDSENRLYATAKLDSEAMKNIAEKVVDSIADKSETLVKNSEGGLEVEVEKVSEEIADKSETLVLNSEGGLEVKTEKVVEEIAGKSETLVINSEGGLEVNIDNTTLVINSEGKIAFSGDLDSEAAEKLTETITEKITEKSETIIVNSEGGIEVKTEKVVEKITEKSETVVVNSEGGIEVKTEKVAEEIIKDSSTIVINSEGSLEVPIDNNTIKVGSDGKIYATGHLTSEGITNITYQITANSSTLTVNSEGKMEVKIDGQSIVVNSEGLLTVIAISDSELNALLI